METPIQKTLDLLVKHAMALELHKPGCRPSFTINVAPKGWGKKIEGFKVELQCQFTDVNDDYQTVKGASFNSVMDEVNRRIGWSDKEKTKMQEVEQSLLALPPGEFPGIVRPD
jgi:hypothetical protein